MCKITCARIKKKYVLYKIDNKEAYCAKRRKDKTKTFHKKLTIMGITLSKGYRLDVVLKNIIFQREEKV